MRFSYYFCRGRQAFSRLPRPTCSVGTAWAVCAEAWKGSVDGGVSASGRGVEGGRRISDNGTYLPMADVCMASDKVSMHGAWASRWAFIPVAPIGVLSVFVAELSK